MRKVFFLLFLILFIASSSFIQSCASSRKKASYEKARVINRPYDEIWEGLEMLIFDDLGCVPKKTNKDEGIIETEWVHRIDSDGTHRWKIMTEMKKTENGVWLLIDKQVQLKDEVQKKINKFKKETRDTAEQAKWGSKEIDPLSIEELYQRLNNKLQY